MRLYQNFNGGFVMSTYEILTIITNFILALTSVISCIASLKTKKDIISEKNEITMMISNFKSEQNMKNMEVYNSGLNTGAMAENISGGVNIGTRK
nr:MAG TPA: hypothetical protein [Caudoviricetes sp.]